MGATAQLGALLERLGASDPMYGEVVGVKDMAEKDIKVGRWCKSTYSFTPH